MDRIARLDAQRDVDLVDELAQLEARSLRIADRRFENSAASERIEDPTLCRLPPEGSGARRSVWVGREAEYIRSFASSIRAKEALIARRKRSCPGREDFRITRTIDLGEPALLELVQRCGVRPIGGELEQFLGVSEWLPQKKSKASSGLFISCDTSLMMPKKVCGERL